MTEEQVFLAALNLTDPADRATYLEKACGGDVAFRRHVEELLAAHFKTGAFLDVPVGKQLEAGLATSVDLTSDQSDGLLHPCRLDASAALQGPPAEQVGNLIGPYQLLNKLNSSLQSGK
jgi:hypothetical protein